jgi:hypothetical protein
MAVSPSIFLAGFLFISLVRYVGAAANNVFDVTEGDLCLPANFHEIIAPAPGAQVG